MIRILIADDHPLIREGIKRMIDETNDMIVRGEASTGQDVLSKIRAKNWDVILLDISMPGRSGLEVLKDVKRECPRIGVLMLSIHSEDQFAIRSLKAGASGYLSKENAPDQLIPAIRKIASGGKYITPRLAERLVCDLEPSSDKPPHEILSDREYQVLRMLVLGKTIKEIAAELCLSDKTISAYRVNIFQKTKTRNYAELIVYAIKYRLVD